MKSCLLAISLSLGKASACAFAKTIKTHYYKQVFKYSPFTDERFIKDPCFCLLMKISVDPWTSINFSGRGHLRQLP